MNREQNSLLIEMQLGEKKQGKSNKKTNLYIEYKMYSGINQILSKWNEKDTQIAINRICTFKSRSFDIFVKHLFPHEIENLRSGCFTPIEASFERYFKWYIYLINMYTKEINLYLKYKDLFEKNFIIGNYLEAKKALDKIQDLFGYSFWLIDARFSLYEYEEGLEKNKEYLDTFLKSNINPWVKYYSDFQSFKVEKSVNNRQYVNRIENAFSNDNSEIAAFFKELLYPINSIDESDVIYILRYTSALSLIDMYNALIKVSCRLISSENIIYKSILKNELKNISDIDDIVLEKIKWSVGLKIKRRFTDIELLIYKIGDLYTKGDYNAVISIIEKEKLINNNFEIYEYYVKSHIMSNNEITKNDSPIIMDQLIYAMYSSYVKKQDVESAYHILTRFVRLFSNSNLGTMIAYFFADKFLDESFYELEKGKLISSNIYNINLVLYDLDRANDILEQFKQINSSNSSYELFQYIVNGIEPNNVEEQRLRWYKIKRKIETNTDDAIRCLEQWNKELNCCISLFDIYQRERIVLELYKLYVQKDEYLKAEKLVTDVCVDNKYACLRFDLSKIRQASYKKSKEWKKEISTPIFTYLFDKEDYTAIYSDVANFLFNNNISKPSDMFGFEKIYGEKKLLYFLKNVCVKEILDSMYSTFNSDEEVENERIEICKYLQKNDPKNSGVYIGEISRILQNQKVRQGVKYFEDEKIDISFDKIYDSHKKDFHENYKRYKEMESLNVDFATYDLKKNVWTLDITEDIKTYSHTFLAFKELFDDYRQEITFGKFGLDPILGARIRHGILQNQIRSVFSKNNIILISKTDNYEKKYVCSLELEKICENLSLDDRNMITTILSEFSKNIDDYIDKIVKEYIRIRIDEKNLNGIFNFSYNLDNIHVLLSAVKKMQNENILREYLDEIWMGRIEAGIKKAKELIQGEFKNNFIEMLRLLEERISNGITNVNIKNYFLNSISKSRTELQQTMNCISEWFKIPEDHNIENFSAYFLIETCDYINRRVITNYDSIDKKIQIDVDGDFIGKSFTYLVDIFIILYTNAFYHSGFIDNIYKLKLELLIVENESDLIITMTNNLSDEVDKSELLKTIETIRKKLNKCIKSGEYYNYEGRSGYIKICKILNYNLECSNSYIEFGLTKDYQNYFIKIKMPKKIMVEKVGK